MRTSENNPSTSFGEYPLRGLVLELPRRYGAGIDGSLGVLGGWEGQPLLAARGDAVGGVRAVVSVVALPAVEAVLGPAILPIEVEVVVAGTTVEAVLARARAPDVVVARAAVEGVVPVVAVKRVASPAAPHGVLAGVAIQQVGPRPAAEGVAPVTAAVQPVAPRPAVEAVSTAAAYQRIPVVAPVELVLARHRVRKVLARPGADNVGRLGAVDGVPPLGPHARAAASVALLRRFRPGSRLVGRRRPARQEHDARGHHAHQQ